VLGCMHGDDMNREFSGRRLSERSRNRF